jgi:tRNA-dihydrouridine synthase B
MQNTKELGSLVLQLEDQVRHLSQHYGLEIEKQPWELMVNRFAIGSVEIINPLISAPMAGISDHASRIFARYMGAALTFSEMITSYWTVYQHKKSISMAKVTDYERPCAVQVFGSEAGIMADAAEIIAQEADIVDVNMGCPVPKVLKTGSGGFLLNSEANLGKIVEKIVCRIKKPLTVKTRIGWDKNNINIMHVAKIIEDKGASAISIHGRTVKQGYSGEADYQYIKKVKKVLKIPVIASGDIDHYLRAKKVLDYTGCDGVMIGRAARGTPWVFLDILLSLWAEKNNQTLNHMYMDSPEMLDIKKEFAKLYLDFFIYFKGYERAVKEFRKYLSWIFKGCRNISKFKERFFNVCTYEEIIEIIEEI